MTNHPQADTRRLARRAEALRARLLRRWVARVFRRLTATLERLRAEAELRSMDERELHDLGLDRGGLAYAARHGRFDPNPGN